MIRKIINMIRKNNKYDNVFDYVKKNNKIANQIKVLTQQSDDIKSTKIGGVPFWPKNMQRPKCFRGHFLSFIMQINSKDIPGLGEGKLISFHYCQECAFNGEMSWGYLDEGGENKYNISVFNNIESLESDDLDIVSTTQPVPKLGIELLSFNDVPSYEDQSEYCNENIEDGDVLDAFSEVWDYFYDETNILDKRFTDYKHFTETKIGGYPTWWHSPEYPNKNMKFIAQIHGSIGNTCWCTGTAYLFFDIKNNRGELVIQTT